MGFLLWLQKCTQFKFVLISGLYYSRIHLESLKVIPCLNFRITSCFIYVSIRTTVFDSKRVCSVPVVQSISIHTYIHTFELLNARKAKQAKSNHNTECGLSET